MYQVFQSSIIYKVPPLIFGKVKNAKIESIDWIRTRIKSESIRSKFTLPLSIIFKN